MYDKYKQNKIPHYAGNKVQNTIFLVVAIAGAIIATTTLFAPIHERAHVSFFQIRDYEAEQVAWNRTKVMIDPNEITIAGFLSGYWGEFNYFWLIALIGIGLTNVYSYGIRNWYGIFGFPVGYMAGLIFSAPNGTDFHMNSALTAEMTSLWFCFTIPMFLFILFLYVVGRIFKM